MHTNLPHGRATRTCARTRTTKTRTLTRTLTLTLALALALALALTHTQTHVHTRRHSAYAGIGSGGALAVCAGLTVLPSKKAYMIGVHVALLMQVGSTLVGQDTIRHKYYLLVPAGCVSVSTVRVVLPAYVWIHTNYRHKYYQSPVSTNVGGMHVHQISNQSRR